MRDAIAEALAHTAQRASSVAYLLTRRPRSYAPLPVDLRLFTQGLNGEEQAAEQPASHR
jgi:hypothetical protein